MFFFLVKLVHAEVWQGQVSYMQYVVMVTARFIEQGSSTYPSVATVAYKRS
jgi:hypothetical protein